DAERSGGGGICFPIGHLTPRHFLRVLCDPFAPFAAKSFLAAICRTGLCETGFFGGRRLGEFGRLSAGVEFLPQVSGDLLAVEAAVFDEDFAGPRSRHDYPRHVDPRHIALQRLRVAHWTIL